MLIRTLVFATSVFLSTAASAVEVPLPGTLNAFNYCLKNNSSPLIANEDLLKVCLRTHARSMDVENTDTAGSYKEIEGRIVFVLELANVSSDSLLTGVSLELNHPGQESGQEFVLGPVGILPGTVSLIPLTNLDYIPKKEQLDEFQPSLIVKDAYGLKVELQ